MRNILYILAALLAANVSGAYAQVATSFTLPGEFQTLTAPTDSTFVVGFTAFDDQSGQGFSPVNIQEGFFLLDGTGNEYRVISLLFADLDEATLTVVELQEGQGPQNTGQIYQLIPGGTAIPSAPQNSTGITPLTKARIDQTNVYRISERISSEISRIESQPDAVLSAEEVQDFVASMFDNIFFSHSLISAEYQDPSGFMQLSVEPDLSQYDNTISNFYSSNELDSAKLVTAAVDATGQNGYQNANGTVINSTFEGFGIEWRLQIFDGLNIPAGSTIAYASLGLTGYESSAFENIQIYVEDVANALDIVESSNNISNRNYYPDSVSWDILETLSDGVVYNSPNFSNLVQQKVDEYGATTSLSVALRSTQVVKESIFYNFEDGVPSAYPTLTLIYTLPSGELRVQHFESLEFLKVSLDPRVIDLSVYKDNTDDQQLIKDNTFISLEDGGAFIEVFPTNAFLTTATNSLSISSAGGPITHQHTNAANIGGSGTVIVSDSGMDPYSFHILSIKNIPEDGRSFAFPSSWLTPLGGALGTVELYGDVDIIVSSDASFKRVSIVRSNKYDGSIPDSRTGTASPVGLKTPIYIGEIYVDTLNDTAYISVGTTSSDWKQITN